MRIQASAGQAEKQVKDCAQEKSVPTMKTACISAEKADALVKTYTIIIGKGTTDATDWLGILTQLTYVKVCHVLQPLIALETYVVTVAFARSIVHTATVIGTLIPTGATLCSVIVTISAKTIHVNLAHAVLKASTAKIGKTMRQIDLLSTRAKTVKVNAMVIWAAKALKAITNACSLTSMLSATQTILTSLTLARVATMKAAALRRHAKNFMKQQQTDVMVSFAKVPISAVVTSAKVLSQSVKLQMLVKLSLVLLFS